MNVEPDRPPIRPAPGPARGDGPDLAWRWRHLLRAPHRLGFFLAVVVLILSGAWWALVQFDRTSGLLGLHLVLAPSVTHGALMTFGFFPLFFSGFLFTAGPKWLGVQPLEAARLRGPLLLQAAGWLCWLAGAHLSVGLALGGAAAAAFGLAWMEAKFWRLVHLSTVEDRLHATIIGAGGLVGVACLGGFVVALALQAFDVARALTLSALWGFVVLTYVTVAHRMIPFFTSSAVPMVEVWRPFWVLWVLVAAVAVEVLAVWLDLLLAPRGGAARVWLGLYGLLEFAAGGIVLWLAVVWGLVQSLKIRLLAMLHIGFVWLGLAFLLGAASRWLLLGTHSPVLGLGALHALSMGFLGSVMVAMVTRVSCGHSGRALVADDAVWAVFWTLQLAVLVRLGGAVIGAPTGWVTLAAALWALVVIVWGVRYGSWYGRPRADGRPG